MGNPPRGADDGTRVIADQQSPAHMPRWVKVTGIVIGALVLVFVVLNVAGIGPEHGPGRHTTPEDGAPPAGVTDHAPGHGVHG